LYIGDTVQSALYRHGDDLKGSCPKPLWIEFAKGIEITSLEFVWNTASPRKLIELTVENNLGGSKTYKAGDARKHTVGRTAKYEFDS